MAAGTIVVMALGFGRDDQTRGPLWHTMWMLSLVVVLANIAGSVARRGRSALSVPRAGVPLRLDPAPKTEQHAER
jgi:hypothetical protein